MEFAWSLAAALVAVLECAPACAATRDLPAGGIGAVRLEVPAGWREVQVAGDPAGTVTFEAEGAGRLRVTLTPVATRLADADLRAHARRNAERLAQGAAVPRVEPMPASAAGYFFTLADSAPRAGAHRAMRQGAMAVGAASVYFTLAYDDASEADAALAALAAMRFVPR